MIWRASRYRLSELERLADEGLRQRLLEGVRAAGFRFVTLDLAGYGRGSSNPIAMAPNPSEDRRQQEFEVRRRASRA